MEISPHHHFTITTGSYAPFFGLECLMLIACSGNGGDAIASYNMPIEISPHHHFTITTGSYAPF
ncbi:hypothetical protein, partial [Prevotella sp.]|uniref:hypothetical protein n=1 Tax=Prevotella sp. TaxID=59823 RepID=UPI00307BDBFE